jgi:hypothetical protein
MEPYAASGYPPGYDFATFFRGASLFLGLFVLCFFAWKAIEWARNRRNVDGKAAEEGRLSLPEDPSETWVIQAISRPSADHCSGQEWGSLGGLGGMNQREQEELFSTYGPRKVRKVMRARRKAREQAQKQNKRSY